MTNRARTAILAALLAAVVPAAPSAQYFGRNKVHYKTFDFRVLKTEHFDIYYYPDEQQGIEIAARLAERWRSRLGRLLDHELEGRQPLVLYASHVDFEQTNIIQGELGEGTGGVTEPLRRRIVLPLGGPLADTDHVIGHELVHAFQFDMTASRRMQAGQSGIDRLPLWFVEGMAEYLSLGPHDPNTAMWLRDAARREQLPTVQQLNSARYFPYRWGQAFWAYVGGRWGDQVIRPMLDAAARSGDPRVAIEEVLGVTPADLSADWHAAVRTAYGPILDVSTKPDDIGLPVAVGRKAGAGLNLGPALSPDGRLIAFISERSLLSLELFVADATTGRVLHRLTRTATDPHYSSLQFVYSAGAWARDSRRIAVATIAGGKPALAVFDARSGRRERDVRINEVDEIFNPTWSPDGRSVAFTGMKGGLTDLFVAQLDSGRVRRLTSDPYADLQPAWSPDGTRIAFATDRFTSRLAELDLGAYRIGLIDPESGRIVEGPAVAGGKNINPQWAPDGGSIYVIADRDGVPSVFRLPLAGGDATVVTAAGTGISGITASSPALSVAAGTGTIAVSVYDDGRYDIYTVPGETRQVDRRLPSNGGILPPISRDVGDVQQALSDPITGLPPAEEHPVASYSGGLQLEALGQPSIAFGASRFGPSIGGGISAYFSDMLGNQTLTTAVQINSGVTSSFSFKNTAAQAAYLNQNRRWNWGVIGGQLPYLSGGLRQFLGSYAGEPVLVEQSILYRQTERSVAGIAAYPFNRAQRVELQAGATQMSFDQLVETQAYSLNTGNLVFEDSTESSTAQSLSLATTAAALISDTSTFGATSPVAGHRYRFEVSPTFGSLSYAGVLADYRRYFMPASFYTLATRLMHYGRYGSDAEDSRFYPLYIGHPTLVRGYDAYSMAAEECGVAVDGTCPAYSRLLGSRMLVANAEFRFPLLRPFTGPGHGMYGPVPVEVGVFADAGVAWNRGQRPQIFGGDREGVSSTGLTLRTNLFGFAVAQFDFVRPLQRSRRNWHFQFVLTAGF